MYPNGYMNNPYLPNQAMQQTPYASNAFNRLQQPYSVPQMQPMVLARVTGIDGARAYQMPPNSVQALFDGERDIFYVKSTDAGGFGTIKSYAFLPIDDNPSKLLASNTQDFVTREEFNALKEEIANGKQPVRKQSNSANADATAE